MFFIWSASKDSNSNHFEMLNRTESAQLFEKAKTLFPGGVNSPVRAFRSVGGTPIFMKKGKGSKVWDADGNEYIDYCHSWGPLILGHAHDAVVKAIAETAAEGTSFGTPTEWENKLGSLIIDNHRYVEKIRFVSSGTEATMSALRLARGFTGRDKVIKFEGCYHGHVDALLVKAGSGLVTLGSSSSAGVPESFAKETIVLPLNDKAAVEKAVTDYHEQIACIVIEPVPANNGLLIQGKEFLQFLRDICYRKGILLFFDEVISGFRVGFEGAAGYYGIQPDMIAFGKILGGGMPVGAYASSAAVMAHVSPEGNVYQAGTLSGNPVAMAAGFTQLKKCLSPGFYEKLNEKTEKLTSTVVKYAQEKNYPFSMYHLGSIYWLAFDDKGVHQAASEIDPNSMSYFAKFHAYLLENGIYMGPSGYEVGFVCEAHSEADIEKTIAAFCSGLDKVFN